MPGTVLFLGASGKIARHAKPVFEAAGWQVKLYDRNRGNMAAQAMGADVIINGLNPPNYHDWDRILPAITREVIAAAKASGSCVIIPGNVYVFGDTPGMWTEDTPHRSISRKGRIRVEMEQSYRQSGVRVIILRAGDFISSQPGDNDLMSMVHLRNLDKGKVTALGDPNAMHAYGYLPDWAQAALLLAERRARLPDFAEVNLGGANFSTASLCESLSETTGRHLHITRLPWGYCDWPPPYGNLREKCTK